MHGKESAAAEEANADGSLPPSLERAVLLRGSNVHHRTSVMRQPFDPGWLSDVRTGEFGPRFIDDFLEVIEVLIAQCKRNIKWHD